jgi:O-antigen/teichoic acid export membrane protein
MQKKFLTTLFITLGLNLLIKPIWILGIDRTFQNRLGLEEYGQYSNLFTFSIILGLLLDFGINNYNTTSLAKQKNLLQTQFIPLLLLKGILSFLYLLLTLILGAFYGFTSAQLSILFVLSINQCMAYASTYFRSTLSGLQLYKTDAYISTVDRLTMVIGGSALLFLNIFQLSITSFVYLQTIGYIVAVIVSFTCLFPQLKQINFNFNISSIKPVFKKSLPYATLALIMMLYTRLDVIAIKKLVKNGDIENGIYAQSTRLVDAINMLAVLVSGLLLPMFSTMMAKRQPLTPMVKLAMFILWVPAIMGVSFCYIHGNLLMQLLYNEQNPYSIKVFLITISSVIPMCMMYVFGTLLTAKGKLPILIYTAAFGLIFNASSNYFMIPIYGAWGAALVALCTHSLVALLNTFFGIRVLKLSLSISHLLKYIVLFILCVVSVTVIHDNVISLLVSTVLYILASILFIVLLHLIDWRTLTQTVDYFQKQDPLKGL